MGEFRMPSLGADMEFGTLVEWRVKPGDVVRRGDVVAEVETQKGVVEVEIFEAGVVEEIAIGEGTKVPVGTVLARVRGNGAIPPTAAPPVGIAPPVAAPTPAPTLAPTTAQPPPAQPPPAHPSAAQPRAAVPSPPALPAVVAPMVAPALAGPPVVRASPAARVLAAERHVELATVAGTGPGGAVTRADVERALREPKPAVAAPHPHRVSPVAQRVAAELGVDVATVAGTGERGVVTPADVERAAAARGGAAAAAPSAPAASLTAAPPPAVAAAAERQAAMRQAIAAAMARAWREIPHFHVETDVDLSRALRWLEAENVKRPVTERILSAALLLKAVALALREMPELNGFWRNDAFVPGAAIHVGVAISLRGGGLIAPAIHDADTLPVSELMAALRDLVQRARTGMLRGSELTDPTITVTNLGDQGVRSVYGVIYPPQVALVGIGKISERPWAEGGMVGARPVVTLTLAADHRANDGHRGARFLAAVDRLLQTPERL